jgi:ABC-type uncharacterized transport system auxiliary subunit
MRYASVLLLFAVAACGFSGTPERTRYRIDPDSVLSAASAAAGHEGILRVSRPTAGYDLDNDAIEVQTGGQVASIENAAWTQPLPVMLQPLIMTALERSGNYAGVVGDASTATATRQLYINVERFTLVYGDSADTLPHVEVILRAELVDPAGGKLLKARRLFASEPLEAVRMHLVIPAFERALARCLHDLARMAK